MKKIISLIVSSMAAINMLGALPSTVYAEENNMTDAVFQEEWTDIINSLEASQHGGIYIENGALHIKPLTEEASCATFGISRTSNDSIVIDGVAQYSLEELKEAKAKISKERDTLEVNSIATSNRYNAVVVTSPDWNEEKKQAVKNVAGIDNIIFEIRTEEKDYDSTPEELASFEMEPYFLINYYVGDRMNNKDTLSKQTLGACVTSGSKKGFITVAHGNNLGDRMVGSPEDFLER